eukprot:4872592-Prymnesium_polylepis.1
MSAEKAKARGTTVHSSIALLRIDGPLMAAMSRNMIGHIIESEMPPNPPGTGNSVPSFQQM